MPAADADDSARRPPPDRAALRQAQDREALTAAKQVLRRAVGQRRASRPVSEREADDLARFQQVQGLFGHPGGEPTVACYLSAGTEPSTLRLVGWLAAQDVPVLLPVLGPHPDGTPRREPDWDLYRGAESLRSGWRGIPEPDAEGLGASALGRASVIVCAAVAGTERGERLGTGGGWYDRALAHATEDAVVVALLNDDEVLPTLPVQPWDRPVDVLVTPTRVLPTGTAPHGGRGHERHS